MKSFPAFGILVGRGRKKALFELLEKNSGLPGPRSNLELMYSFASSAAAMRLDEKQWSLILEMASLPASRAPGNTPREFITACGVTALGALLGQGLPRPRRRAALAAIRAAASDPRWRTREAAAMALQLLGEKDLAALRQVVDSWLPSASLLEMRAIAAALAHPPVLGDADFALFCLEVMRSILVKALEAGGPSRRTEAFRVLRQGLGYAVSVIVEKRPREGFALLEEAASMKDQDIAWIVKENLKKKRLTGKYPEEVRRVASLLERRGEHSAAPWTAPRLRNTRTAPRDPP